MSTLCLILMASDKECTTAMVEMAHLASASVNPFLKWADWKRRIDTH